MDLQIGIRLHDTAETILPMRLKRIKNDGFSCIHLAISKIPEGKGMDCNAFTPGFAMYLKHLCETNKIDIAVLGCYLNLATPDEKKLKENLKKYEANIRLAAIIGSRFVGTETGAPNVEYCFEKACHTEEALHTFIQNLKIVVGYAERMGVVIGIEPVYRHIVWNAVQARKVLDEIKSPNLQIIFDPVNLLNITNYKNEKSIIEETMKLLKDEIAVVHLKDYQVKDGKLISVAAGTGNLDYKPILKFLKKYKPHIQVTLENTKPENAIQAREYIENMWESL